MSYNVYIGFDHRFKEPYEICKHSLHRRSLKPIKTHKLDHKELRKKGLFTREWTVDRDGFLFDNIDNRPFSTEFSHSRFLTPALAYEKGVEDLCMFVDCDFLFLDDVNGLFKNAKNLFRDNPGFSCVVVKHEYDPKNHEKMDGSYQFTFGKKLWSSLIIFNLNHAHVRNLTPEVVNTMDGRDLHNFFWTDDLRIGSLSEIWNFIPDHSEDRLGFEGHVSSAIHYTEGGPWFKDYEKCRYSDLWYKEAFIRNRWGL